MKVFDGFASPRWSEAEPGVGREKTGVPGGGQQETSNRERRAHRVPCPVLREEGIAFEECYLA
jgi:hypothetical protein